MTSPTVATSRAAPPADPSGMDELVAEFRRFEERMAAEAVRYSKWADEIAAAGMPEIAELVRDRVAIYETFIHFDDLKAE